MREILFRGKSIEDNKWVYGDLIREKKSFGKICTRIYRTTNNGWELIDVDSKTVGRFTGLTDDNGNKIFEGDIIRVKSLDWDYEYTTKVYYSSHTLCVNICSQDYDYTSIGFANDIWDEENSVVYVIGNIYDNPELLEE